MKNVKDFETIPDTPNIRPSATYLRTLGGSAKGRLIHDPTYNCQICLYGGANCILGMNLDSDSEDPKKLIELKRNLFKKVIYDSLCKKKLMFIDVGYSYEERTIEVFGKDRIVFKSPYKSTNGSSMVIFLINIENL